jgi:ribosomal protein S18 acetylase RimI-like enzyme
VTSLRLLRPGDEPALVAFLAGHRDQTMFLRANLGAAGLVDEGRYQQGTYAGAFDDGALSGVAAVFWNGMLCVCARDPAAVARAAVAAAPRPLTGLAGAWAEVVAARAALGLDDRPAGLCSKEDLYALDLADLVVPARLAYRRSAEADLPLLGAWRRAYGVEALHDDPAAAPDGIEAVRAHHERGCLWVATDGGRPVAMSMFNARTAGDVQVGGVYTPPELRGRGHARAAVAGSLLEARAGGATRAILFTGDDNAAAAAAYRALGFRIVGDYGLVLFAGH